ncbi:MAG: YggT family protein [Acidimicrobiales bacterium]
MSLSRSRDLPIAILGLQGGDPLRTALVSLVELYLLIMIIYAILSWFPVDPGSAVARFRWALGRVIEPVLAPVRRLLPQTSIPIDLSFIIVFLGLQIIVVPIIERVA